MKEMEMKSYTNEEIFNIIEQILKEVAPLKVNGELNMDTSITDDFAFDSIDIMDTLIKLREKFMSDNEKCLNYDVDKLISSMFDGENELTMKNLCKIIDEIFNK